MTSLLWNQVTDSQSKTEGSDTSSPSSHNRCRKGESSVSGGWCQEGYMAYKTLHQNLLVGKSRGQTA